MYLTRTTASLKTLPNEKRSLFLDGRPFQAYGVQLRPDRWRHVGGFTNQRMSEIGLFRFAKELNVNCVQVPVTWKDCEPEEGIFDWTNLDWALEECRKYGLRLEIVWFGSNVCGAGWASMTPEWITNCPDRFEPIRMADGSAVGTWYQHPMDGQKYTLCPENPELQSIERRVVTRMMTHLLETDQDATAIAFQAENEPSLVQHNPKLNETDRCHCARCNALFDAFDGDATAFSRQRLALAIDRVASWVKASARPMLTRINFIPSYYMMDQDVETFRRFAPHVDLCGYDSYEVPPQWVFNINRRLYSVLGNTPHLSELGGDDPHCVNIILDLVAAGGCGAEIYQLCGYAPCEDNWVITPEGIDAKPYTDEIRQTFGMLLKAMEKLAVLPNGREGALFFNGEGFTQAIYEEQKVLHGWPLSYQTQAGGIGIAFRDGNDLVLMSSKSGMFTLPCPPTAIEEGAYQPDGNWLASGSQNLEYAKEGSRILMKPYSVCRISLNAEKVACEKGL